MKNMITNADITLYNHKYNKNTRLDDWQRIVIRGVHFYEDLIIYQLLSSGVENEKSMEL